ncbi:MAG TPA: hypothetical protein VFN23_04170 [Ktedonobacteraceae bacterium]|nr:hypothetical protein [Ktedonobacteraceae bacterium]
MPAGLDVVVFIAQFVALDVGGLSLVKMARHARLDGHEKAAVGAERLSRALISIMIAGVVVVVLEQIITFDPGVKLGIDSTLLIARSILAVLYSHVIHALKAEDRELTSVPGTGFDLAISWTLAALAAQNQQLMSDLAASKASSASQFAQFTQEVARLKAEQGEMLSDFSARQEQALVLFETEQQSLVTSLQEVQNAIPVIDSDAVVQMVLTHLQEQFDAWKQEQISLRQEEMTPQLDAPKPARKHASKSHASGQNDASTKIITMRQPSTSTTDKKAAIHQLLEQDQSLSSYRIAALVGCSEATARRVKNEFVDACYDASQQEDDTGKHDASEQVV